MIHFLQGNILESSAEALINTVNLVGVMGKGIALQFKNTFPENFKAYKSACKNASIGIGKLFITKEKTTFGEKLIINFPTKTDWRKPSEYIYIEKGLDDLLQVIEEYKIKSIALPPLGAGNGGLNWHRVKSMIEEKLNSTKIEIYVYEPTTAIKEKLRKERIKLTEARALLLYVLFDLVRHGEYVSEFSAEKICYFLQKFGGEKYFKLHFEPKYYGPYSGRVRHVFNYLNGSYIMGYSDMNKKPFESISLIPESFNEVKEYIENAPELGIIANNTMSFLSDFYSDFGLELMSSVDYLLSQNSKLTIDELYENLSRWSNRKSKLFSEKKYIDIARNHILKYSIEV